MKRLPGYLLLAALFCLISCSSEYRRTRDGVSVQTEDFTLTVQFYSPSIVRVTRASGKPRKPSLSIVKRPERVRFQWKKRGNSILLVSDALTVQVGIRDAAVSFFRKDGTQLVSEVPGGTALSQAFLLEDGEAIYGLGQHQGGVVDWRGHELTLLNENKEISFPLVHSSKGYALYWDNYSPTRFSDGPEGMRFESEAGEQGDYFLIAGKDADDVVAGIRDLTGQAPMNPLWTFGYHQSRERYGSQEELVGVVKKYRELEVPLDGIVQDWQYWGVGNAVWNAVKFDNPAYPDPKRMMEDIHGLHAHCLISVWPSFGPETQIYKEMEKIGALLPIETFPPGSGVRVYDAFNPQARELYWSHMKKDIFDLGLDGWWLDATEPEHKDPKESDFGFVTAAGSFRAMRNAFPLYSCGGVYDHQRAETADKRVFILTRSAAIGLQRYGVHCWSGDLESTWRCLQDQIPEALHFSLCGMPYWNADIGGFFSAGTYPKGYEDPAFHRLYIRWTQLATFTGMMRSHGTNTPREIYRFGEPGDPDFEAIRKCIRLRYLLLPYLYSTAWQVTSAGASLMRALWMDWPSDSRLHQLSDEFLFGQSLLVAPMLEEGTERTVYLPEGGWTDFWSGSAVTAGSFPVEVPMDAIPLYVRAGTVLPVGPEVQYASEKPWDTLQIRIYPGADGSFVLYEDEGDGYGYEQGQRSEIRFEWDDAASRLTIRAREGSFPGMLAERDFRLVRVRPGVGAGLDRDDCDQVVHYDGRELTITLNDHDMLVSGQMTAERIYSGFADAHDTYNAISPASDGRIYYVLSSQRYDVGGQFYRYDPATGTPEFIADLSEALGEKQEKYIAQGKSHVEFIESDGKLWFATHAGYYQIIDGAEQMPVTAPEGWKLYPGGHFVSYDMATGQIEDLALAPAGDGIITMAMDRERKHLFGLTWPVLFRAGRLFCVVPAAAKADAVRAMVCGPVGEACPATILRWHDWATLYTDTDSGKYIV